jgi:predicted ribosome quality control (RQC) complex YloA/Tae2 family protein
VVSVWPVTEAQGRPGAGEAYHPPLRREAASPSDLARDPDSFEQALSRGADLLAAAPALGPLVAREITRRASIREGGGTQALYDAFAEVVSAYPDGPYRPHLVVNAARPHLPVDVAAIEVTPGPGLAVLPSGLAGEAVMAWHQAVRVESSRRALAAAVRRAVRTATARFRRKIERQTEDLATTGRPDELKRAGELLLANLHTVNPGDTAASLTDYDGRTVTIPLDPRLSPSRNAQRYFERYRKAGRAAGRGEFRRKAVGELAWLEAIAYDLAELEARPQDSGEGRGDGVRWTDVRQALDSLGQSLAELQSLERAMEATGYPVLRPRGGARRPGGASTEPAAPRPTARGGRLLRYLTDDGFTVLAGRSARQNEALSLKTARPDDIWLHARGLPGSHVILRVPPEEGREIPETSLLQAAALAAHLSTARGGGKVAVDYTRARHLRRPKGVPPGLVLYDPHETVLVDTDKISLPREDGLEGEA